MHLVDITNKLIRTAQLLSNAHATPRQVFGESCVWWTKHSILPSSASRLRRSSAIFGRRRLPILISTNTGIPLSRLCRANNLVLTVTCASSHSPFSGKHLYQYHVTFCPSTRLAYADVAVRSRSDHTLAMRTNQRGRDLYCEGLSISLTSPSEVFAFPLSPVLYHAHGLSFVLI